MWPRYQTIALSLSGATAGYGTEKVFEYLSAALAWGL